MTMKDDKPTRGYFWWFAATGDLVIAPALDALAKRFTPGRVSGFIVLIGLIGLLIFALGQLAGWLSA